MPSPYLFWWTWLQIFNTLLPGATNLVIHKNQYQNMKTLLWLSNSSKTPSSRPKIILLGSVCYTNITNAKIQNENYTYKENFVVKLLVRNFIRTWLKSEILDFYSRC